MTLEQQVHQMQVTVDKMKREIESLKKQILILQEWKLNKEGV